MFGSPVVVCSTSDLKKLLTEASCLPVYHILSHQLIFLHIRIKLTHDCLMYHCFIPFTSLSQCKVKFMFNLRQLFSFIE